MLKVSNMSLDHAIVSLLHRRELRQHLVGHFCCRGLGMFGGDRHVRIKVVEQAVAEL